MRYQDYKCDGCGEAFSSDDDIVVCPDCGAPQHRLCFQENNRCVNSHLHSDTFHWQGEKNEEVNVESKTSQNILSLEEDEKLICPNCEHPNPKGSTHCRNCGMKFTIFGFNLAQAAQEPQEKKKEIINPNVTPKMTPPDYPPPFTVGDEEDENNHPGPLNENEQMERFLSSTISNVSGYETKGEENSGLFKGPYPDDMKIDGIHANTIGAFIARNAEKYIRKFKSIDGFKLSFNWAAFFFTPYWFFYRKLYKSGIIYMTLLLCIGILQTPFLNTILETYSSIIASPEFATMSNEEFFALLSPIQNQLMMVAVFSFATTVLHIIAGLSANAIYKKYTFKHLKELENEPNKNQKLTHILKYGGISPLLALAAYFAEWAISLIAGMFM